MSKQWSTYGDAVSDPHLGPHEHDAHVTALATEGGDAAVLPHLARKRAHEDWEAEVAEQTCNTQLYKCGNNVTKNSYKVDSQNVDVAIYEVEPQSDASSERILFNGSPMFSNLSNQINKICNGNNYIKWNQGPH